MSGIHSGRPVDWLDPLELPIRIAFGNPHPNWTVNLLTNTVAVLEKFLLQIHCLVVEPLQGRLKHPVSLFALSEIMLRFLHFLLLADPIRCCCDAVPVELVRVRFGLRLDT